MKQMFGTAEFICSAGQVRELPASAGDEFAVIGRSNVGKSSFINHVCADHGLARTSKRPGTTVCANLFKLGETLYWVDLPGYGFARTSGHERDRWAALIRDYCGQRRNLAGIIWLVDIRHIGVAIDRTAYAWLRELKKPVLPLLAKADKLSGNEQKRQVREFMKAFGGFAEPVPYSIHEHVSRERFWTRFEAWRNTIRH
jgi:GTP-binding protein